MSLLAHATYGAPGFESEKRDLAKLINIEARERVRGRKKATGRFESRAELCGWVWNQYLNTKANATDIAAQCRVSQGVVQSILNTGEGRPVTQAQLEANSAEVAVLLRGSHVDQIIDRLFNMEFLSDQHFAPGDQWSPEFHQASLRDVVQYRFLGYII